MCILCCIYVCESCIVYLCVYPVLYICVSYVVYMCVYRVLYVCVCMLYCMCLGMGAPRWFSACSIPAPHTTFLTNCGRSDSPGTTTRLRTVVGGMHGHAPCKILSLQQSLMK